MEVLDAHALTLRSWKRENIAIIVSANTTKFKRLHWQQSRSFHSVCTTESCSRIEKKGACDSDDLPPRVTSVIKFSNKVNAP